jgi:hypothetical protein
MADFSGGPGFLAFLATAGMVIGSVFLFRSLQKHLRKVRTQPPALQSEQGQGDGDKVAEVPGDR